MGAINTCVCVAMVYITVHPLKEIKEDYETTDTLLQVSSAVNGGLLWMMSEAAGSKERKTASWEAKL